MHYTEMNMSLQKVFGIFVLSVSFLFVSVHCVKELKILQLNVNNSMLNHLIFDESANVTYVGAVNKIFKVDFELTKLMERSTGPKNDSVRCHHPDTGISCNSPQVLTDNYNKILLVYRSQQQQAVLITCGSVYQGACETWNIPNLDNQRMYHKNTPSYMYAVAANSPNASTIAHISDGGSGNHRPVLYVASTFSRHSCEGEVSETIRVQVPALSTRKLYPVDDMFSFQQISNYYESGDSFKKIKEEVLQRGFSVNYVTGFASEGFSYFLTTQPKSVENPQIQPIISKIVQICHNDTKYYSYVDIPLQCGTFNIIRTARIIKPSLGLQKALNIPRESQEKVLIGTFTNQNQFGFYDSAVCVYKMSYIRNIMLNDIKKCYRGNTDVSGGGYLKVDSSMCKTTDHMLTDKELLCNTRLDRYINIVGVTPAVTQPALVLSNITVTSLALTTTTDFTVAFMGTHLGHLKKIVIQSNTLARLYGDNKAIVIDQDSPINQDMVFDQTFTYLFAISQRNIARIKVENCEQYSTCYDCLSSRDPYCGWCTLENRCSVKSKCRQSTVKEHTDRWTNGGEDKCIAISDVSPSMASATEVVQLYLTIIDLPQGSSYSCTFIFNEFQQTVNASRWSFGLQCMTPNITGLGIDFGSTGHQVISLAVTSLETGKIFVTKNFTFYNCSSYTSCSKCVDNPWTCDWCIYDNKCKFDSIGCSPGIIFSKNRYSDRGMRGPIHCPRIDSYETGSLYIPNKMEQVIDVRGFNFPMLLENQPGYRCIIFKKRGGSSTAVGTMINARLIRCNFARTDYQLTEGIYNATLRVVWGNNIPLENDDVKVSIYSCESLGGSDCSLCKSLHFTNSALGCRWCNGECKYSDVCHTESCPAPQITDVSPTTGHTLGGTRITISGRNLGAKFADIAHNVTIANVACAPISELYLPSKKIVCVLGVSVVGEKTGTVSVLGQSNQTIKFMYKLPKVFRISPRLGPSSGGSSVTITGAYLDTGNVITVEINGKQCQIVKSNQESVLCTTTSNPVGNYSLQVQIDGKNVASNLYLKFYYLPDPTISKIFPLKSFSSGGRTITVVGSNLHTVKSPKIYTTYTLMGRLQKSRMLNCTTSNSTMMTCPTPSMMRVNFQRLRQVKRSVELLSTEISFIMDNVKSVQNVTGYFSEVDSTIMYYEDPVVFNFTEEHRVKIFKGEVLTLKGSSLDVAASKQDVMVLIGNRYCNVTNLLVDQIYCTPPAQQPPAIDEKKNVKQGENPKVIVRIGFREFHVGYLQYEKQESTEFPLVAIIGSVAGVVLVACFCVVLFCIAYSRQKTKSKRECVKMQLQLDSMESNVRNACKQAFAELQTDMTDLTNDLDATKEPFYDFEEYTFKILFPGMVDHVILRPPVVMSHQQNGNIDRQPDIGIQHFNQLLQNKHFLLLFIRTLERQKTFAIRDKSNVASLLLILYQKDMEYATEILKALLSELVEKSVEGKHPKLMLRRTESVVEKLLANWLSLCLYQYLVNSAGTSLYILYKAIKVQVEKGPVDQVTGDARYSLSEDRLLRAEFKMEPEVININVEYDGKRHRCRVLDCDTISQAKEKMLDSIFRYVPYSQRPLAQDLDLEWNKCVLQDEDSTTAKLDGWKQFNTLKHYKIMDGVDMIITQHQNCRTLPRSPNGSVHSSGFSFREKEAIPITRTDSQLGSKFWHLVKQHDDNQNNNGAIKMSSEIFLTRLLSTKGTLKQYIDDFFKTILTASTDMPPVIKYLFDFLDDAANKHNITDIDVVHTWKCNSLLLRFWVNIIKNPDFVFDIHKPGIVDSCLSVVAQTFMDSCSTIEHRLGKDSPSNKLLFAKDIPKYKKWVEKYFSEVRSLPPISDQDLNAYLADVSRLCTGHFTKENALYELYNYVHKYAIEINEALESDRIASAQQLPAKLGHVITAIEGPSSRQAYV